MSLERDLLRCFDVDRSGVARCELAVRFDPCAPSWTHPQRARPHRDRTAPSRSVGVGEEPLSRWEPLWSISPFERVPLDLDRVRVNLDGAGVARSVAVGEDPLLKLWKRK